MSSREELSLNSVVVASDDQVSCELQGEMVVLSLREGEYYGLNSVAAAVWTHIETPQTVVSIRDALLEEFSGVSEEQCTHELLTLLQELAAMELIRIT
jgi:hypothetical protein